MSTTLYFRAASRDSLTPQAKDQIPGGSYAALDGSTLGLYMPDPLTSGRGTSWTTWATMNVTGPTNGIELAHSSALAVANVLPPFAADTTISGSITFNFWAYELGMTDNSAINCRLMKWSAADGSLTEFHKTSRTTEMSTSRSLNSWSETPASTDFAKGDRVVLIPFFDDSAGANMANPSSQSQMVHNGTTGDGDSNIVFTETFTFASDPTGTTIYPTTADAGINPGSAIERETWTSRGTGVATAVTNTVAGYTSPIQVTSSGGGTALEWYTKTLMATTLAGPVLVNVRVSTSAMAAPRCEIHRVDADGSNATLYGIGGFPMSPTTGYEEAFQFWVYGPDLAITSGQRLRVRLFIDDAQGPMSSGYTFTTYYAGSAGATGDTYLTFSSTLLAQPWFTLDAVLRKTITGTGFMLNAETITPPVAGTPFTLDALISARRVFGTDDRSVRSTVNSPGELVSNVSYATILAGNYSSVQSGFGPGQTNIENYWWKADAFAMNFPPMTLYAGETVTSATLHVYPYSGSTDIDFDMELYQYDWASNWSWGGDFEEQWGNAWRNQAWLQAATKLAHLNTDGIVLSTWYTLVDDGLASRVNTSAGSTTQLWLSSSRYRLGYQPGPASPGEREHIGIWGSFSRLDLIPYITARISRGTGITLDAEITGIITGDFSLNAEIAIPGQTYWTTPANLVPITLLPTLAFTMPDLDGHLHFEMQLDTVDTFDGANLRVVKSVIDQAGWEYWNGSSWVSVPSAGVDAAYVGNEARLTLQVPLGTATWYRRVRTGRSG